MAFFNSAVGVLQTLVVALGAGLGTPANQSESLRDWHEDLRCHQAESGLRQDNSEYVPLRTVRLPGL